MIDAMESEVASNAALYKAKARRSSAHIGAAEYRDRIYRSFTALYSFACRWREAGRRKIAKRIAKWGCGQADNKHILSHIIHAEQCRRQVILDGSDPSGQFL